MDFLAKNSDADRDPISASVSDSSGRHREPEGVVAAHGLSDIAGIGQLSRDHGRPARIGPKARKPREHEPPARARRSLGSA